MKMMVACKKLNSKLLNYGKINAIVIKRKEVKK